MKTWNRREWLAVTSGGLMMPPVEVPSESTRRQAQGEAEPAQDRAQTASTRLLLDDYQPISTLQVPVTRVERPRFPVIDVHTHLSWSGRAGAGAEDPQAVTILAPPSDVLAVMDRRGVRLMVNLTGGRGTGLERTVHDFQQAHPGRFLMFTEPWWSRAEDAAYPTFQADEIGRAARAGARGLKVLKTLGLYLRDGGPTGRLVSVDDRRFDPMWEACAALNLPVAIHAADPVAFFRPADRFNERYEELHHHPDWSFHGRDFPTFDDLIEARNRLFARHPRTTWIALHVGHHAEDLAEVSRSLDRFPNMHVELGARIGELGRQPRAARRFFERYQDRIMFGTDAVPNGTETPQQLFGDELYEIYYRFLETEDEYFDYAPAPIPPQGRWRIYGLGLPDSILKKVYHDNAARLLRVE
jgi:predicted TIM-barrel fold metal-dependent hydrolase